MPVEGKIHQITAEPVKAATHISTSGECVDAGIKILGTSWHTEIEKLLDRRAQASPKNCKQPHRNIDHGFVSRRRKIGPLRLT